MIDLKDWFPEFFTSTHPVPPSYMRHVDPEVLDPRIEDIFRENNDLVSTVKMKNKWTHLDLNTKSIYGSFKSSNNSSAILEVITQL